MNKRSSLVAAALLVALVGAFFLVGDSSASARAAATASDSPPWYAQVRAEYVDLSGNRDEATTTFTVINRSLTKSLFLGEVWAMGPDGLGEVLAIHAGLGGVELPPLGSIDVVVDSTQFPGLKPELEVGDRGVESIAVSFIGPKDALRLSAEIVRLQPCCLETRMTTWIEGHLITK